MTDADKIALTVALVVILAAAAFALGIVRRLTPLEGSTAMRPIGFMRF